MKKWIIMLLIMLGLFLLAKPFVQEFLAKDLCLDLGGRYDDVAKKCEK